MLPRRDPARGEAVHLRRREEVVVAGRKLLSSMSAAAGIGQEAPIEWDSAWKKLVAALQEALQASPDKQIQVRVETTRGR